MAAPVRTGTIPNRIGSINGIKINSDWTFNVSGFFSDPEGQPLTYSASFETGTAGVYEPAPSWFSVSNAGVCSVARATATVGIYRVKITVTDTENLTAEGTFQIEVLANNPPILPDLSDQVGYYGSGSSRFYYQHGIATDLDNQTRYYTAFVREDGQDLPLNSRLPSLTYNTGARQFTAYFTAAEAGTYTIRVYVTDLMDTTYKEFQILVRSYNQPISANFDPLPLYAYPDKPFTWRVPDSLFSDPEGLEKTYTFQMSGGGNLPEWLIYDPVDKSLKGTAVESDISVLNLELTASDGENSVTVPVILNVQEYAQPIIVTPIPDITVNLGKKVGYIIPIDAYQSPSDEILSFDFGGLPGGVKGESTIRRITGVVQSFDDMPNAGYIEFKVVNNNLVTGTEITFNDPDIGTVTISEGVHFSIGSDAEETAINIYNAIVANSVYPSGDIWSTPGILKLHTNTTTNWHINKQDGIKIVLMSTGVSLSISDPYETVTDFFDFTVVNNLGAPIVANRIPNQVGISGENWSYAVPANTFQAGDEPIVGYRAYIPTPEGFEDGLPDGITFDPDTRTFSGILEDLEGLTTKLYYFAVVAISESGAETVELFYLTISINPGVQPLGKTEDDCKLIMRFFPQGSALPNNTVTPDKIILNFHHDAHVNLEANQYNVLPGDTIAVDGQDGQYWPHRIYFNFINGSPGIPVYITNINGKFVDKGWTNYLWKQRGCNNTVWAGQGTANDPCGIILHSLFSPDGTLNAAIAFSFGEDNHFNNEFTYLKVAEAAFSGFTIKNTAWENQGHIGEPDPSYPERDNMSGARIHRCLAMNVLGEGIYMGHGFYTGYTINGKTVIPALIRNVRVEHNVVLSSGWDGYQFKNTYKNAKFRWNYAYYTGWRESGGQNEGVNVGSGWAGEFAYNFIHRGRIAALRFDPSGNSLVHHNIFIGDYDYGFQEAIYGAPNDRTDNPNLANEPNSAQYVAIFNNTFIGIRGIYRTVKFGTAVDKIILKNNLFVTRGSKVIELYGVNVIRENTNNLIYGDESLVHFRDLATFDLRPKSISPVLGAGADMSEFLDSIGVIIDKDFYGNPINWAQPHVGALTDGEIDWTSEDRIQALFQPSGAPEAPSSLQATVVSDTRIDLSWIDNSNVETGFIVERKQGAGSWIRIGDTLAGITTFSVANLLSETEYSFRVYAINTSGSSSFSNVVVIVTNPAATLPPGQPTNLTVSNIRDVTAFLNWTLVSNTENFVQIEIESSPEIWETYLTLPAMTSSRNLTLLTPETNYKFRVKAINAAGSSPPSSPVSFTTTKLRQPSTEKVYWAYIEGGKPVTGSSRSEAEVPLEIKNKPVFFVISNTSKKSMPTEKYSVGQKGEMRYEEAESGIITRIALCVEDNVWAIINFSDYFENFPGTVSWSEIDGEPSSSIKLTTLISQSIANAISQNIKEPTVLRFRLPKVRRTVAVGETDVDPVTIYQTTIPADTFSEDTAWGMAILKTIWHWAPTAAPGFTMKVIIGGVTVLDRTITSQRSYHRDVYFFASDGAIEYLTPDNSTDGEGQQSNTIQSSNLDWSIDNTIQFQIQHLTENKWVELRGGYVELYIGDNALA